jgi:hypothetical protein
MGPSGEAENKAPWIRRLTLRLGGGSVFPDWQLSRDINMLLRCFVSTHKYTRVLTVNFGG